MGQRLISALRAPMVLVVPVALVAGFPSAARAGGFTMSTFGGRRLGMQANMAAADDLTALFHNPAGLADQPGVRLYVFMAPSFLSNEFKLKGLDPVRWPEINPPQCGQPGRDPCPWPVDDEGYYRTIRPNKAFGVLPFAAVSTDLGFIGPGARKVVVALGAYAPNFYGAFLPENAPTAYHVIGGVFLVSAATVGVGLRINRYISVGANLSYNFMYLSMAQKISVVDALTPRGEEPENLAIVAQDILGDIRLSYSGMDHGVGWGVSMKIDPSAVFSIGMAYLGATPARFEGPVKFKALGQQAQYDPDTLDQLLGAVGYKLPKKLILEMPIPPSLLFGINYHPCWWLEVGFDIRFWLYNIYKRQVLKPIYDPDEEGEEPLTQENLTRDKMYKVSYQFALGVLIRPSYRYRGLELMTGFGYDESPIPNETFTLDNPSINNLKSTWGVRWQIDPRWRVAFSYLFNVFMTRVVVNSRTHPPTNGRGKGYSHSPALEVTCRF